jgi:hypothetical protein
MEGLLLLMQPKRKAEFYGSLEYGQMDCPISPTPQV